METETETETETVLPTQPPDRQRSLSSLSANAKLATKGFDDGKDGSQDAMIDETNDDTDDEQCKDEIDDNVQPQHRKVGIPYNIPTFGDIRAISATVVEIMLGYWYSGVLGFGVHICPIVLQIMLECKRVLG